LVRFEQSTKFMTFITKSAQEFDRRATPKLMARLVVAALKAQKNSYAPYSKFHVGFAVIGENGRVYSGCNVEIANYAGMCAEESTLGAMIIDGCLKFTLGLCVGGLKGRQSYVCSPCGKCRQALREFGLDEAIAVGGNLKKPGSIMFASLDDMLPGSFGPEDLGIKTQNGSKPSQRTKKA
jgi:cytidine deaminase